MWFKLWHKRLRRRKPRAVLPHPLYGRHLRLETLEDRYLPSTLTGAQFGGMSFGAGPPGYVGAVPPDTTAAAGPNYVVEAVNSGIATYNKTTGALVGYATLSDFFGPVGATPLVFDPQAAYDDISGRYIITGLEQLTANQTSFLDIAVSNTSNPLDGVTEMHRISVGETDSTGHALWGDYDKLGFNADAVVVSLNMFTFTNSFSRVQLVTFDKSTLLDRNPATLTKYNVDRPSTYFTMTPAVMHGAQPGDPLWFVQTNYFGGSSVDIVRMTNVLSSTPTFSDSTTPVPSYLCPPDATQPNGPEELNTGDARILSVAWRDGMLVAAHGVGLSGGTTAHARWYEFDTTGSAPTLTQSGTLDPTPGAFTFYPSIDIAANGALGMTFLQSSSTQFLSMYITGRAPDDAAGTMQTPVRARAGQAHYSDFTGTAPYRTGDYSGIAVDPVTGTTFWAANEYATAPEPNNWSTWITSFVPYSATTRVTTFVGPCDATSCSPNWSLARNWSNGIPDAGTVVILNNSSTQAGATVDAAFAGQIAGLQIQGGWGTRTLTLGRSLTVTGAGEWDSGTISGAGLFVNQGTLLLNGGVVTLAGSRIDNSGTIIQMTTGNLNLSQSTLNNLAGGVYDFRTDTGIAFAAAPSTVTNSGTIRKSGGTAVSSVNTLFQNTGGTIDVQHGTFQIVGSNQATSTGGTFTLSNNSTLDLTGGGTTVFTGTYTGSGSGTVSVGTGTLQVGAAGATFNFAAGLFQLAAGNLTVSGTATLTNTGALNWTAGSITINTGAQLVNQGALNLAGAAAMALGGGGTLANRGTINQTGAGDLNLAVTLANQANARYILQANSGITNAQAVSTFTNAGTLAKTAGTGTSRITGNVSVSNTGTVDVETGTLALAAGGGFNSAGTFTVARGATLDLTGGAAVIDSGTFTGSGAGTVLLGSGTLTIGTRGAVFNFPARLFQWTGGNLSIPANVTLVNSGTLTGNTATSIGLALNGNLVNNGTLTVTGNGTLGSSGTGSVTNNRSLTLAGAGQKGTSGTLTNRGTGTINLAGSGLKFFGGPVSNQGTVHQTDAGNLALGGPFENQPGALYDLQGDAGLVAGSFWFLNAGVFQKSGGTGISTVGTPFGNLGTVRALSGTLAITSDTFDVSAGTLLGGTWAVLNGATLNLNSGVSLTANNTTVTVDGAGSTFTNLANLAANDGSLTVQHGGTFRTGGNFNNAGSVTIDGSSTFTITGSLVNFAGGTLSGGTWLLAGTLQFPGANIVTNDANLILDGSGPARVLDQNSNNGLANFAVNDVSGSLRVQNGEVFATPGDFTNTGSLSIDASSTFVVSSSLTNFDPTSGTLSGGTYVVAGTLQFPGANITADAANLTLDGSGPGQVLDQLGNNGLANLTAIAATGNLTLQNGYVLTTAGDLANLGYLLLDATSRLNVSGNYTQDVAATLEIQLGGAGGPSGQLNIAGTANLNGTLTLTPVNGYVPATGDTFAILTFGTRNGSDFANPPPGFAESYDDTNGILTVIAQ